MKYIVEVNARYLVSIEAESPLAAEHAVLEYDGIWGACIACETVSLSELVAHSNDYREAWAEYAACLDAHEAADDEVKRLEEQLSLAKENRAIALQNIYNAKKACANANDSLGIREN